MVVETWYVAGSGVLIGSGDRWLLLTDPQDETVIEALWSALGGPLPTARVLEILDRVFGGSPFDLAFVDLALIDRHHGDEAKLVRGGGTVRAKDGDYLLGLGTPGTGPARRLLGGVVAAGSVELCLPSSGLVSSPGLTADPQASSGDLIDGIPLAILEAKGPDGPPPPRIRRARVADSTSRETTEPDPTLVALAASAASERTTAEPTASQAKTTDPTGPRPAETRSVELASQASEDTDPSSGTGDHDGSTVFRPEHLVAASSAESVQAVWCPQGHPTPPDQPLCRICRSQVAPQHPQRIPRPVLGGLHLPTGEVVPLDRAVVLGRRPQPLANSGEWPHLVTLSSEHSFVSRLHLHLSLEGWQVIARDLGSRGGTALMVPGQAPVRMVPDHPYLLEPGHALDLADTYEIRFEVGPDPAEPGPLGGTT